ncbi:ABC transporter substrate-binding protein [Nevskia sp.]|uniref:ABC transporter substrate-binding protein n=1 Tax=Nevskia sp. TaxID=1929292 RepID=UPI0025DC3E2A|nr:ABC transporter substrate-binding protein [Nevskia sp.]
MRFSCKRGISSLIAVVALLVVVCLPTRAADKAGTIRIGVLQFGTVAWTLDTLKHQGFDKAGGFEIEVVPMAAPNAAQIALQGGAVDMITTDWLWVNRNRADGRKVQFVANSTALGGLYVRGDSGIKTLSDLKGREIGIAGTPVDKSWLFLQAYAKKTAGLDLKKDAKPSFAAPPALNEFILRDKLPAVLNFWPYGARLKAAGMTELLDMKAVLKGLGLEKPAPMVGWVFTESWSQAHPELLKRFLVAVDKTNAVLRDSDPAWVRLKPLMKAATDADFAALRDAHRDGIRPDELRVDLPAIQRLYALLAEEGGEELVGKSPTLDPATFLQAGGSTP